MASILKGVTCLYGIPSQSGGAGGIANLVVQSYTLSKAFELNDTVQNEDGLTITARYDGVTRELSVDGIAKTSDVPEIGAAITFVVKTDVGVSSSFTGVVESVEEKGTNKGFVAVSLKAKQWELITTYT